MVLKHSTNHAIARKCGAHELTSGELAASSTTMTSATVSSTANSPQSLQHRLPMQLVRQTAKLSFAFATKPLSCRAMSSLPSSACSPCIITEGTLATPDGMNLDYLKFSSSSTSPASSKKVRKVVCLHGFMDNANTFTKLAPHLVASAAPSEAIDLHCLDFLGHGRSSHKSPDSPALLSDNVYYVREFLDHVSAGSPEKIPIIGHSMGSGIACIVASVYPDLCSRLVMLEGVGPFSKPGEQAISIVRKSTDKRFAGNRKLTSNGGKVYANLEAAVQTRMKTAVMSPGDQTLSHDAARVMLERATESVEGGGVKFIHDPRLTWPSIMYQTGEMVEEIVKNIQMPTLILSAVKGWPSREGALEKRLELFIEHREEKDSFKHHLLEGSHHLHLDEGKGLVDVKRLVAEFLEDGFKVARMEEAGAIKSKL
jgi:pimeloyl-ACP methyl ester carboxylesterase